MAAIAIRFLVFYANQDVWCILEWTVTPWSQGNTLYIPTSRWVTDTSGVLEVGNGWIPQYKQILLGFNQENLSTVLSSLKKKKLFPHGWRVWGTSSLIISRIQKSDRDIIGRDVQCLSCISVRHGVIWDWFLSHNPKFEDPVAAIGRPCLPKGNFILSLWRVPGTSMCHCLWPLRIFSYSLTAQEAGKPKAGSAL